MLLGRILSPVHALGPGNRVALWTMGCSKNCKNCISPEFKPFDSSGDVPVIVLNQLIRDAADRNHCTGLTISGGDPFEQPEELLALLQLVRNRFDNILVYTGFLYEDLKNGVKGEHAKQCLSLIDVLIDGPYIEEFNQDENVLRGSANQRIIFLTEQDKEQYLSYMEKGRLLENFVIKDQMMMVGIPHRRFFNE